MQNTRACVKLEMKNGVPVRHLFWTAVSTRVYWTDSPYPGPDIAAQCPYHFRRLQGQFVSVRAMGHARVRVPSCNEPNFPKPGQGYPRLPKPLSQGRGVLTSGASADSCVVLMWRLPREFGFAPRLKLFAPISTQLRLFARFSRKKKIVYFHMETCGGGAV
jgi:hypothetical protein